MEKITKDKIDLFHVKHLIVAFLSLVYSLSFSQGVISMKDIIVRYPLPEDCILLKQLNEAPGYKALNKQEREVAYYLNYSRRSPSVFLEKAINVFLINHPETKSSYTRSLQKKFEGLLQMPVIIPDTRLSTVSKLHAADLSSHNVISHRSTNGQTFQQRVGGYIKGCGAESIHAAQKFNPLEAVLSLLFDFNVPDLGHRKSLLDPRFSTGGFGVSINSKGNSIAVIDFSCQ